MSPVFEHPHEEFGRQVISAQTCGRYEPASPTERWYCVRTAHNMEYVALVDLRRLGFSVHLSLFVEATKRKDPGGTGLRRGDPVIRRTFPGYVFVALDLHGPGWGEVFRGRGVLHLLPSPSSQPWPMPVRKMAMLIEKAGDTGYFLKGRDKTPPGPFVRLSDMTADERNAWLMDALRDREKRELEVA